jgi:hypothetical protein
MQFADSASNIAPGAQTTTLSFSIFKIFLLFAKEIRKGKGTESYDRKKAWLALYISFKPLWIQHSVNLA